MFGASSKQQPPDNALRIQTSVAGKCIPMGWGRARLSGNLIWTGDFKSKSGGVAGGKGGGGKGGGSYTYSSSVIIGLCAGPITAFSRVWNGSNPVSMASISMSGYLGDSAATPWPYMTSAHPDQALAYRGLATAAAASMPLGGSSTLPNLTFELVFGVHGWLPDQDDTDPAAVTTDFLTNATNGAGFPSAFLGDLAVWSNYCIANGLVVSPVLVDQAEARSFLKDLLLATNSEAVWSGGVLTVVPYGDVSITANGRTYTAPSAPLYSLSDADFQTPQGSNSNSTSSGSSSDPVQCTRMRPSDQMNHFEIEYLDRDNSYNATVVTASDDAAIALYGLRKAPATTLHFFCLQSAALLSAQLMLGREAVRNTYAFTLGPEYILLDPMDIVAITDAALGLNEQWVRIKEITENVDGTLTIQAEDMLFGTGSAPLYAAQPPLAVGFNLNAAVTGVAPPVIWEPTYALAGGTEIWLAIAAPANFGGAEIWVSTDDETYQLAGTFNGVSRMGSTTGALPSVTAARVPPTIDTTTTLDVDMSESGAQLISGTVADALSANTLCYVNGEYIAYETATLTSGSTYALTYLVRGLFDSAPNGAPSGSQLVRLSPGSYFRYPITTDRIGQTLWFKVLPFNAAGGGEPSIDVVSPYGYAVSGVALAGPLATPANVTTSYVAQYTYLAWTEVSDFRGPDYEVRKGATWGSGQRLGTVAHPPFLVFGDDTYWVAAVVNPAPGVTVYSTPVSLSIQGAAIVSNAVASWDEAATGWTGTRTGGCVIAGAIITTSDTGSGQVGGTYEIPSGHQVDVGRVCACNVLINWTGSGFPAGQNVLSVTDWLAITDLLGAAAAANASVYPEIAISQDGSTWGAWQRFVPGAYSGRKFKARMQIITLDPQTAAALLTFTFTVAAPQRDDHYLGVSIASGGTTISFKPDGSSTAVAFNGGPNGAALPAVQGTILGASSGDTLVISSLSASGCTVQILNGGTGVARTVNLLVQGY